MSRERRADGGDHGEVLQERLRKNERETDQQWKTNTTQTSLTSTETTGSTITESCIGSTTGRKSTERSYHSTIWRSRLATTLSSRILTFLSKAREHLTTRTKTSAKKSIRAVPTKQLVTDGGRRLGDGGEHGEVAHVGEIPICHGCGLMSHYVHENTPLCVDCWERRNWWQHQGTYRYVTKHGKKRHETPLCPAVRGSDYKMVKDEMVYLHTGRCDRCDGFRLFGKFDRRWAEA